jgi:uncharacterized membrane protein YjfL (UPF0719 family)
VKNIIRMPLAASAAFTVTTLVPLAASAATGDPETSWHAHSLGAALWQMALFAIVGVLLAAIGYKLFDLFTPGQLHKEILENKNTAAALIGASVILGTCILVAAAMIG